MVGMGHARPAPVVERAVVGPGMAVVEDDGGRCGCVAGEAFAEGGFDAVAELCPGETPVEGGAAYVDDGLSEETDCEALVGAAGAVRCGCCSSVLASSARRRFVPRVVLSLSPKDVAFNKIWCL